MSDTSPFGFGRFVPGFDFLQSLAKGTAGGAPAMPSMSNWVAPTVSVEELTKRIEELKAVQFWLEQNTRALAATVQALEVQKMTLSTLQGMNVAMGDLASAFAPKPPSAASEPPAAAQPRPAPEPPAAAPQEPPADEAAEAPAASAAPGVVDPLQWWGALTSQFQQIAAHAMQDAAHNPAVDATRDIATEAMKTASGMASHLAAQSVQGVQDATRMAMGAATAAAQAAPKAKAAPRAKPAVATKAPAPAAAKKPAAKKAAAKSAPPSRGSAPRAAAKKPPARKPAR